MSVGPIRLLLVEDNPGDARLFELMLREAGGGGYDLAFADRLGAAVGALEAGEYDAALLDLSLPDAQGLETLDRARRAAPRCAIVVLTGTDDEELGLRAVQRGAQDYLVKGTVAGPVLDRAIRYAVERRRTEQATLEARSLAETVRSMEQVLGVIAHELRTPLTSLRLISEYLLTEEGRDMSLHEHFLRSINAEVLRMADMVTTILEAARLESGAARWNWATVTAEEVCQDAMDVVRPLVDASRVELAASASPAGLSFAGDKDAVRRLLINLISNALRHTPSGRIDVRAEELIRDGHRWVRLAVRDTGAGIDEQVAGGLGTAFALNAGVASSSRSGGTGLGLAICRGIAAAHGGSISLSTRLGWGSTFTATLRADLAGPVTSEEPVRIFREAAA